MSNATAPNRWLLWGLTTAILAGLNLQFFTVGAVTHDVEKSLGTNASQTAILFGAFSFVYGVLQIPSGLFFARYKPTRLLIIACLAFSAGNLLFGYAPNYGLALLGRLLAGIGGGFFFLGYVAIAAKHFEPHLFARLLGFNQSAKFVLLLATMAAMPALLAAIGWRNYFGGIAVVYLVFLACLVWVDLQLPKESRSSKPRSVRADLTAVLALPQLWYGLLIGGLTSGGIVAFAGLWYLPYVVQLGFSRTMADWMVALMMFGMGLGMFFAGWVSDRLRRRKAIIVAGLAATLVPIAIIVAWPTAPHWLEAILAFSASVASSFYYAVLYVLIKESVPDRLATTAVGILNTAIFVGASLMQYLPGLIIHLFNQDSSSVAGATTPEFQWALLIYPVGLLIGLILSFRLKETAGIQPQ